MADAEGPDLTVQEILTELRRLQEALHTEAARLHAHMEAVLRALGVQPSLYNQTMTYRGSFLDKNNSG